MRRLKGTCSIARLGDGHEQTKCCLWALIEASRNEVAEVPIAIDGGLCTNGSQVRLDFVPFDPVPRAPLFTSQKCPRYGLYLHACMRDLGDADGTLPRTPPKMTKTLPACSASLSRDNYHPAVNRYANTYNKTAGIPAWLNASAPGTSPKSLGSLRAKDRHSHPAPQDLSPADLKIHSSGRPARLTSGRR